MVNPTWRERGYVPDSDEEDDIIADRGPHTEDVPPIEDEPERFNEEESVQNTLQCVKTSTSFDGASRCDDRSSKLHLASSAKSSSREAACSPTPPLIDATRERTHVSASPSAVDRLQTNIDLGLEIAREILRGTQSTPVTEIHDASDLPENIGREELSAALAAERESTRRTLRQRNAIQLHPYAIEDARYRRNLMSRGLQPIRIASSQHEQSHPASDSSDEDEDSFIVPRSQPVARNRSAPTAVSLAVAQGRQRDLVHGPPASTSTDPLEEDEELPSLENLLHRPPPQLPHAPRKRQKTVADRASSIHAPATDGDLQVFEFSDGESAPGRVAPLSPPRSGDDLPTDHLDAPSPDFRFPRGLTPAKLPTSMISSEMHRQSSSMSIMTDSSSPSSATSEQSIQPRYSPEINPDVADARLEKMARRIKGVLPAAFLRMRDEQPSPSEKISKHTPNTPLNFNTRFRGIAKRVEQSRKRTAPSSDDNDAIYALSDGLGDEESQPPPIKYNALTQKPIDFQGLENEDMNNDLDEVNDEIDYMVPVEGSRRRQNEHRPRKRQKRIENVWGPVTPRANVPLTKPKASDSQARKTALPSAVKKTIASQPQNVTWDVLSHRRSLLDAPDVINSSRRNLPQFIRLATRRATTRSDKGRKRAPYRRIRLATPQENAEAQEATSAWHNVKEHDASHAGHGVLAELTNFNAATRFPIEGQARGLRTSLDSVVEEDDCQILSAKLSDSRSLQQLSKTSRRTYDTNLSETARQYLPNRHKGGQVLSSVGAARQTRPAQLEEVNGQLNGALLIRKTLRDVRRTVRSRLPHLLDSIDAQMKTDANSRSVNEYRHQEPPKRYVITPIQLNDTNTPEIAQSARPGKEDLNRVHLPSHPNPIQIEYMTEIKVFHQSRD